MPADAQPQRAEQPSVFVNWVYPEENHWEAVWQCGDEHRGIDGSRDEVIQWALAQDAAFYWIFDGTGFVPLAAEGA